MLKFSGANPGNKWLPVTDGRSLPIDVYSKFQCPSFIEITGIGGMPLIDVHSKFQCHSFMEITGVGGMPLIDVHSKFQCPSFIEITGVGGMPLSVLSGFTESSVGHS